MASAPGKWIELNRNMLWFDPAKGYGRLFEPHGEDFVFYPSNRGGGKVVTKAEYDVLVAGYRRKWGTRFRPGYMLFAILAVAMSAAAAAALLGCDTEAAGTAIGVILSVIMLLGILRDWQAPRLLVRGRPDVMPPRSRDQRKDAVARMLSWPMIAISGAIGSLLLWASIMAPDVRNPGWWLFFAIAFLLTSSGAATGWRKFRLARRN